MHVIASITTKNAAATVSALQGDTVSTLLAPAGVSVVPGTVKAQLGAPVVPAPAPATATGDATTATPAAESVPSTGDATTTDGGSSSGGGGSNAGAIAGAVVGVIGGIALLGGGFWVSELEGFALADTSEMCMCVGRSATVGEGFKPADTPFPQPTGTNVHPVLRCCSTGVAARLPRLTPRLLVPVPPASTPPSTHSPGSLRHVSSSQCSLR